jgi:hypothetical protein
VHINKFEWSKVNDNKASSSMIGRRSHMSDFANKTLHSSDSRFGYSIVNELIVSRALTQDIQRPLFLAKALRARNTGLTVWPQSPGRRPEPSNRERYICVVAGKEEFRIVSPVFK